MGLLLIALLGCVVKVGDPSATADPVVGSAPADFTSIQAHIDALMTASTDSDQRDRLAAASDLARRSARLPPEAQQVNRVYLDALLRIEERNSTYAAPVLTGTTVTPARDAPVEEEALDAGPAPAPTTPADTEALVFQRREEAGARYLAARELSDPVARRAALTEVQVALAELLQAYPDSQYAEAIQRNLAMVEQDLAAPPAGP